MRTNLSVVSAQILLDLFDSERILEFDTMGTMSGDMEGAFFLLRDGIDPHPSIVCPRSNQREVFGAAARHDKKGRCAYQKLVNLSPSPTYCIRRACHLLRVHVALAS